MLICNGDFSFECSTVKTDSAGTTERIQFDIFAPVSPDDIKRLFADDSFYFYDGLRKSKLSYTDNANIVGLRITYSADMMCKITMKLTKRSC